MSDESIAELLGHLVRDDGTIDEGAVGELLSTCEPFLRAVVRRRMATHLRAKFDSADVVQSVWVQVLDRVRTDGGIRDEAHLRALLVTIARRRLASKARHRAVASEADLPGGDWAGVRDSRHGTPSEVARTDDMWGRMLSLVPHEHHAVLQLRREGHTLTEIAERVGLHEGSVRRILRKLARGIAVTEGTLPPEGEAG